MSEGYSVDATVIGAGVVGLACARQLAEAGLSTVLLEREGGFGQGVSSRNSEVIHAGLYYPVGSWKARLCGPGRERLYDYCARRGVMHRRIGKWLVATTDAQIAGLETIARAAAANGVDDLAWIDAATARRIEPALRCAAVLASPSTGIIDSHGLMSALADDFARADGMLVLQAPLRTVHCHGDGFELEIDDSARSRLQTRYLVNAAGLDAPHVAST
ncbi:MAG TPA: FAD-dependent oxidoreductase, partial [Rhodocyclaceae bacterium]|nr:FAD-dependent oxidoreductase [Rhodocyclaceae bacterium]